MKKNRKKKMIVILSIVLVIVVVGLSVSGNYFYNFALNPNYKKGIFENLGDDTTEERDPANQQYWLLNESENVFLDSDDELKLHAYQIKNTSDKFVIICHGYRSNAKTMGNFAKKYHDMGYNVLLPDARGHGESEGDYIGMGWDERLDMLNWIDMIIDENPNAQIVLYGISMGGATVMMTSGEKLPDQVKCIIEDCGYTSVWDEFAAQLKDMYGLPAFPILNVSNIVTKIRAGYDLKGASAVEQVAKSEKPILFIHGDQDTFVPYSMLDKVYEAAKCEKEKLVIEGAVHGNSESVAPEKYWNSVNEFLGKYVSEDI